MQNLSHYEKVFRVLIPLSVHKQKIEINANITMGVAVRLIIFQPNCEVLALQFISQPEVIDDKATKPKTRKSFIPCTLPRSLGKWFLVRRLVEPINPKFQPMPINIKAK